jgi:hypothetical protein
MATFTRSLVDTTYDVATDVRKILKAVEAPRVPKTQIRFFFVGEDHYLRFDQERRQGVARGLRQMSRPLYPLHTLIERALPVDPDGLPNLYEEQSSMGASFRQRNTDVADQVFEVLRESHTLPDFVVLFGENHEMNQGGRNPAHGLCQMIADGIADLDRNNEIRGGKLTDVSWILYRSAATCIARESENVAWKSRVVLNDDSFLGFVAHNTARVDHNMLLAQKCLVKGKFLMELRTRDLIATKEYWEIYTTADRAGAQAVREARKDLYSGGARLTIESVNPAFIIRAIHSDDSPRKSQWKELGKSVAH